MLSQRLAYALIIGLVAAFSLTGFTQAAAAGNGCAYVIAASLENGALLKYLRTEPNSGAVVLQGTGLVSPKDKVELGFDTFWALIPASEAQYIADPVSGQQVQVPGFYVVSLLTGGTLRMTDNGDTLADFRATYVRGDRDGARPFLFVPLPGAGYRMGMELRYAKTGHILTLGGSARTLPADKTTIATDDLLKPDPNIPRGYYHRKLLVFAQNCDNSNDGFANWTKEEFPRVLLQVWGLAGDQPHLRTRAKQIEDAFPSLAYYDMRRVEAAAGCPDGSVAVGFKCSGDRCDEQMLVCRSYYGSDAGTSRNSKRFPIADQGDGVPATGDGVALGAIKGIRCPENRQCTIQYLDDFLNGGSESQCRWVAGPDIEYWDTLYRDRDAGLRPTLNDKHYRPNNEAWCGGTEVMAGIRCGTSFDPPATETFKIDRPPYCTGLEIKCCNDPKGRLSGRLYSPSRAGGGRASLWSDLYGDTASSPPRPYFSCPAGHVAAGFDCGDRATECKNKSMGCKRIALTDDSKRKWAGFIHPRGDEPAATEIAAGAIPPNENEAPAPSESAGIAVTGMFCTDPTCKQIAFEYLKPFNSIAACRWTPLTNGAMSAPGECTASEFLGGLRCKDGDCSTQVDAQCCVDPTGRLAADDPTRVPGQAPPRVPKAPVSENLQTCWDSCESQAPAQALKGCGLSVGDKTCAAQATLVLFCYAACERQR
jgi:hypothetical protein